MTTEQGPSIAGAVLARRYRLTKKLGEGGMGAVYAAETLDDGQPFAIKILHPEFLGELTVLTRFLDEARACQRLIHPNVVRVFESATAEDGSPFMVMELLDGVPLSAYTQGGGRVPAAQAVSILQAILAGLGAAHAQGLVHRDLKPDNVFLARERTGSFVVKVLDFGIAKVMDVAGGMGQKTKTGMLLGTPAYMSPEQITSAKDVDIRSDLWSAGVLLYEMLSGRQAFPAPTEFARLSVIMTHEPEPVGTLDPKLTGFDAFLAKALQKDREKRFGTAMEMAMALAEAAEPQSASSTKMPVAAPLDRLPDVPSVLLPSILAPGSVTGRSGPATPPTAGRGDGRGPGGTLQSATADDLVGRASEPKVSVVAGPTPSSGLPPEGRTLPSQDLPMIEAGGLTRPRGIPALAVVLLVLGALFAGALIGYAVAHHGG